MSTLSCLTHGILPTLLFWFILKLWPSAPATVKFCILLGPSGTATLDPLKNGVNQFSHLLTTTMVSTSHKQSKCCPNFIKRRQGLNILQFQFTQKFQLGKHRYCVASFIFSVLRRSRMNLSLAGESHGLRLQMIREDHLLLWITVQLNNNDCSIKGLQELCLINNTNYEISFFFSYFINTRNQNLHFLPSTRFSPTPPLTLLPSPQS